MPILTLDQVLAKSSAKISTLNEPVKTAAELLVRKSYALGIMVIITEALRTIEYQNKLYGQGRTTPGPKVTNARGGYSNHNFGFAFDFALIGPNGKSILWDTRRSDNLSSLPDWSEVVDIGKSLGLEWGGDWRSFVDLPHFQMVFGLSTAEYRAGKRPSKAQVDAALARIKPVAVPTAPVTREPVALAYNFVAGDKDAGLAFVYDQISYVPLRDLANFIGIPFGWDNEEKAATLNNKKLQDIKTIEGKVYVQLRPIAEGYGKKVGYDAKKKAVSVS